MIAPEHFMVRIEMLDPSPAQDKTNPSIAFSLDHKMQITILENIEE